MFSRKHKLTLSALSLAQPQSFPEARGTHGRGMELDALRQNRNVRRAADIQAHPQPCLQTLEVGTAQATQWLAHLLSE